MINEKQIITTDTLLKIKEMADEYEKNWHIIYPKGQTVAPYCNHDVPAVCFEAGAKLVTGILQPEIERLKEEVTRHKLGELMIAESYQKEIYTAKIEIERLKKQILYLSKTKKNAVNEIFEDFKEAHDQCDNLQKELSEANATIQSLKDENEELKSRVEIGLYNLELRTKENQSIIDNQDETKWAYWRKRAGEMTDAWRDQRDLALTLTAKVKRYEEALEFYANILSWTHLKGENDFPWGRPVIFYEDCEHVHPDNEWCSYGGKRARAALNQTSEDMK